MSDEIHWYYVVSENDGDLGYIQMSEGELGKLRDTVPDNISRADPPKDLTGWRTIILPTSSFHKFVGYDKPEGLSGEN